MFSHNTMEANNNRVLIEDLSFLTVREMLRYMYCEKVENLDAMALDLLIAADKVRFFTSSLNSDLKQ